MSENELTEKKEKQTFSDVMTNSLMEVKEGLPQDFNITRFVNNAVALFNDNDQLASFAKQYGMAQPKAFLMKSAFLGLDPLNKEVYPVVYGNKLNFQIDYRGSKKLAKKYSIRPIKEIYAKLVRQGDDFKTWSDDKGQHFEFSEMPFSGNCVQGAFAVCQFEDGSLLIETMTIAELENTRKHSKASNSMAWKDFTGEMYKKTVLHRLCKGIEIDFENAKQREIFENDMAIEEEKAPEVVDVFGDAIDTTAEVIEEE